MKSTSIAGFDWDHTNLAKLEEHGLEREEIESEHEPVIFQHPDHPERWVALGLLPEPDDRFVVLVSFELDDETRWVRVVTAFEPTAERWWRAYAKTKGIRA